MQTFVSDEWTLEYDLALGRNTEDGEPAGDCAEMVYIAAHLARRDDDIFSGKTNVKDEAREAASAYATIVATAEEAEGCCKAEWVASTVYAQFAKEGASKAIAAQYLAERLNRTGRCGKLTPEEARARLPKYIVDAIDYVTGAEGKVNDE